MALVLKNPPANAGDLGLIPELGRFPGVGHWQLTLVLLTRESTEQRSLEGCSP